MVKYCTVLLQCCFVSCYIFLSNRELWENSQQLISRAISMSKIENSRAYEWMEEDKLEERWMIGDND